MWRIPASKKASTSRPRRKISLARVTRILHKRVFITFAPESRSDVAAGWGGRWCWPLPLGAVSWTGRRAQQPTLRLAFSWFSPVISCCLSAVVCPNGRSRLPPRTAHGCGSGAKALGGTGELDRAAVPLCAARQEQPRAANHPLSVFSCSLQGRLQAIVLHRVRRVEHIAVPAAVLRCRGGSPHGRVGQILPQCTARTSSA
jgi:hypothetical protein